MITVPEYRIEREILIDAPTEVVWRTITEPDEIQRWFADSVELDRRAGGQGRFVFDQRARTKPTVAPFVVEVLEPPECFAFRWSHPAGEVPTERNSVLVTFRLSAAGPDRTRLQVTETGLEQLAWPDADKSRYADGHRSGWDVHLARLVELFGVARG